MRKKKLEKTIALENTKLEVNKMLENLEKTTLCEADFYVVDKNFYYNLLQLDTILAQFKTASKRGSVYSIDKIVNIINPEYTAVSYHLTIATKSSLVTNKGKCLDRLEAEREISKNKLLKNARDKIANNELTDFEAMKLMNEVEQKIIDEKNEFKKLKLNPDKYDIIISTYKEKKDYGQVNYQFIDKEGKKKKTNKHLSIVYPNILIYEEPDEIDNYRSDMMVAKFIKEGYRALGNVYIKTKNSD